MGRTLLYEKVCNVCYTEKVKKKQTAIEYLMSLDPKMRESVMAGFQQLDEDLKEKEKFRKLLK